MSPPAARVGDMVLQPVPHCHSPMHPPAPVPTPVPHPALPLPLVKGVLNVIIGNQPAATVTSMTAPCMLPGCVPGGPGLVAKGSTTVLIGGLPAARVGEYPAARLPNRIDWWLNRAIGAWPTKLAAPAPRSRAPDAVLTHAR